jgi:hypothetical protein
MGMRPIDMITIVGKTHDATMAAQANARAHTNTQDHIAVRQAALADLASEQVSGVAEDDRLELSSEGNGSNAGGGGHATFHQEDETEDELDDRTVPLEHRIDFLA